ncbi:hypothetical protein [Methanoregula sp.]|uniref:hypothetical protein n=1 Tax=Methanoregula sp. TaxID=2052170 RepID=UPI003C72DB0D
MRIKQKKILICSLSAILVILFLLTSACVSVPVPAQVPHPVAPPVGPAGTPTVDNASAIHVISPPAVICNCPMEPVESPAVTPAPTPDDGLCHCP